MSARAKPKERSRRRVPVDPQPDRLRRGDVLVGSKEAIALLDVPASSLTRLVVAGELPLVAYPAAGMIFRRTDVEALAKSRA